MLKGRYAKAQSGVGKKDSDIWALALFIRCGKEV
jgi:hypothetical protein